MGNVMSRVIGLISSEAPKKETKPAATSEKKEKKTTK